MVRRRRRPGWALARDVLGQALGVPDAVGRVSFLGEGLTYETWWARCVVEGRGEVDLVARLPRAGVEQDAEAEVRLIGYLSGRDVPFRLPGVVATVPVPNGAAVVQEMVPGVPLEMRAPRSGWVPWKVVAEAAAGCHGVDTEGLDWLPSSGSRRAHALERIGVLEKSSDVELREALEWARSHLPGEGPACLLHGDLLGQNILVDVETDGIGVIDWAYARIGDPAYDLAIVTRGARRPFQTAGGMERLLEAYNKRAEREVRKKDVRLHELCLLAGFHLYEEPGTPAAEQALGNLRGFLRGLD